MQVKHEDKNGVTVCYITGEIDINTAPQVKKAFDKLVGAKKEKLLINLKDVSYVDSSGLATLVEILKCLRSYGGKLKLSNLSAKVKSLFAASSISWRPAGAGLPWRPDRPTAWPQLRLRPRWPAAEVFLSAARRGPRERAARVLRRGRDG